MFANAKNTLAKAKLVKSKIPDLYKLVVAFNVTEINKNGSYKFPVQSKCAYVSGDIAIEDVTRCMQAASLVARTNNIVLVE
jgi:hypothetical protein